MSGNRKRGNGLVFHHGTRRPHDASPTLTVHFKAQQDHERGENREARHSQFQQCQVRIAIKCPVLALLHNIVLKHRCRLRVVPIEAVQDGIDMRRPRLALVKGEPHVFLYSLTPTAAWMFRQEVGILWFLINEPVRRWRRRSCARFRRSMRDVFLGSFFMVSLASVGCGGRPRRRHREG